MYAQTVHQAGVFRRGQMEEKRSSSALPETRRLQQTPPSCLAMFLLEQPLSHSFKCDLVLS